ncbi:TPA: hypothetical protein DD712_03710 [Candidatus Acetothermia bacterium]|nr:hypothetical protein [Candidatus Acetothermia bacterium]
MQFMILPFLTAALICSISSWFLSRRQTKFVDREDGRQIGGPAVFIGIISGLIVTGMLSLQLVLILIGLSLIFIVGLVDDLFSLSPRQKMFGQFLAAIPPVAGGVVICSVTLGVEISLGISGYLFTLLWIVGLVNAANLIDGLDGLLSLVLIPALAIMIIPALTGGNEETVVLSAAGIGAIITFYRWNHYPAKLLLGDSGSELLGYLLAVLTLTALGAGKNEFWHLVPAMLIAGLPLADTIFAVVRRKRQQRSIFCRDQDHIHHRLCRRFGPIRAVIILVSISLLSGLVGLLLWQL